MKHVALCLILFLLFANNVASQILDFSPIDTAKLKGDIATITIYESFPEYESLGSSTNSKSEGDILQRFILDAKGRVTQKMSYLDGFLHNITQYIFGSNDLLQYEIQISTNEIKMQPASLNELSHIDCTDFIKGASVHCYQNGKTLDLPIYIVKKYYYDAENNVVLVFNTNQSSQTKIQLDQENRILNTETYLFSNRSNIAESVTSKKEYGPNGIVKHEKVGKNGKVTELYNYDKEGRLKTKNRISSRAALDYSEVHRYIESDSLLIEFYDSENILRSYSAEKNNEKGQEIKNYKLSEKGERSLVSEESTVLDNRGNEIKKYFINHVKKQVILRETVYSFH